MKADTKSARRAQIEQAAYTLVAEKGFAATSMLAIAKAANASNETLYNWYGSKIGLFQSMVESNAGMVRSAVTRALQQGANPLESLRITGQALLTMLTGEHAVALNRAAAADISGTLGQTLAQSGRGAVLPLICDLIMQATKAGTLSAPDPAEAAELYLAVLIGDVQIRRVTGQIPPLTETECKTRSDRAIAVLQCQKPSECRYVSNP